jgi:hypothetical protein
MAKIIGSPTRYIQGRGELANLAKHAGAIGETMFILVDKFVKPIVMPSIEAGMGDRKFEVVEFGGECSMTEINRVIEVLKEKGGDVVVGIGGGKTHDTAKAVGYYTGHPVVIVPTIASTDAPCSALSVIYTDEGVFEKYLFLPSNPNIVLVDQNGQVTPVAAGNATITISYGIYSITVDVTCDIPAPVTELTLKFSDVTLSPTNGLTLKLYDGELDPSDITWTSSDEAVAYVENGVVTAVDNGKATITATNGDLSATCKIIVSGMNHETGFALATTWGVKSDATLHVGETIEIYLINKETNEAVKDLQWTNSNDFPKCCTVEASEKGVKVTAVESTANVSGQYVFIQTEYEGEIYKFIIRVKAAEVQQ